jgi:RNA polymerase sigma-70 factor, ECF subfamily
MLGWRPRLFLCAARMAPNYCPLSTKTDSRNVVFIAGGRFRGDLAGTRPPAEASACVFLRPFSGRGRVCQASAGPRPSRSRRQATPVNNQALLSVLVNMPVTQNAACDESACDADADAAVRQLYARHAMALHVYVERFCPDRASADDIVQETFIRAWRHLPQLSADRQLVTGAIKQLSPAHRAVLVEIFYGGDSLARAASQLGIPHGTARSRLHYALQALRHQLEDHQAAGSG